MAHELGSVRRALVVNLILGVIEVDSASETATTDSAAARTAAIGTTAPDQTWLRRLVEPFLFVMAAFAIGRAMVQQNLLTFEAYAYGKEQMPFAARYMMQPVLRWAAANPSWVHFADGMRNSSTGPMALMVQAVNSLCLVATGVLADRIRALLSPPVLIPWLTRWLLLWVVAATYVVRYEQRFAQAYDLVSVLVFTAGLLFCARSWALPFLALVLLGTYNRETTLFLIPVWLAVNLPRAATTRARMVHVAVACFGVLEWVLVRRQILHWIARTSPGWSFTLWMNLRMLLPHHLPQVLTVGGYMAIPLLLNRSLLQARLLRRLWLGTIPFLLAAVLRGWLNETRIFGEVSALFAISGAIAFEVTMRQRSEKLAA